MSSLDLEGVGKTWLDGEKEALDRLLDRLQEDSEKVRKLAREALALAAGIASSKLQGNDTVIAERALHAVRLNIQAVAAIEVADAVIGFASGAIQRVAKTIIGIIATI